MNKKLKILIPTALVAVVGFLGYKTKVMKSAKDTSKNKIADLLNYRNTVIGTNIAINKILSALAGGEYVSNFKIQSPEDNYAIIIDYDARGDKEGYTAFLSDEAIAEILEKNATILFALVDNLKGVVINVAEHSQASYTFTREELEEKYGINLASFVSNEKAMEAFMNSYTKVIK